ncbi:MAG: hypothetical protein LBT71_01550 [Azoarcus sp.]|nr:hypothetical protein [Azoarcus sp.]
MPTWLVSGARRPWGCEAADDKDAIDGVASKLQEKAKGECGKGHRGWVTPAHLNLCK